MYDVFRYQHANRLAGDSLCDATQNAVVEIGINAFLIWRDELGRHRRGLR
jgi:hypothetical protein